MLEHPKRYPQLDRSPAGQVVRLTSAATPERGDDPGHGVVDVGEVTRRAGQRKPRQRLAGREAVDPARERHLRALSRPVHREGAHDQGIRAVLANGRLGSHLAQRVGIERRCRRVLGRGQLERVAVHRRAGDEHEANAMRARRADQALGEEDVRLVERRGRAAGPHAGQAGEVDHGVDAAQERGIRPGDPHLGAAGLQRGRGGGPGALRVGTREVVHAADSDPLVEQRFAEAAPDEAEPAGHEHAAHAAGIAAASWSTMAGRSPKGIASSVVAHSCGRMQRSPSESA